MSIIRQVFIDILALGVFNRGPLILSKLVRGIRGFLNKKSVNIYTIEACCNMV